MNNNFLRINYFSIVYGLILTLSIIASCAANRQKTTGSAIPHITEAQKVNVEVSKGIEASADNIDAHVSDARGETPRSLSRVIFPFFDGILFETGQLRTLKGKLDGVNSRLVDAEIINRQLEKDNVNKTAKIDKLEEQNRGYIRKMMSHLVLASVIGLGVCAVLIYTGNKLGIAGAIGCVTVLGISVLVGQYTVWLAVGAGVLCIAAIGFLAHEIYKRNKDKKDLGQHNEKLHKIGQELAQTVEATKVLMSPKKRSDLFGVGPLPAKLDYSQSEDTKTFVKELRVNRALSLAPSLLIKPKTVEIDDLYDEEDVIDLTA